MPKIMYTNATTLSNTVSHSPVVTSRDVSVLIDRINYVLLYDAASERLLVKVIDQYSPP